MADCPMLIDNIVTSYDDVEGDTLSVSNGTVLNLRCVTKNYILDGDSVLTCVNGLWSSVMPSCIHDESASQADMMDRIVLIVCAIIVVILLLSLLAICLVYRTKRHRFLTKQASMYKTSYIPQSKRNYSLRFQKRSDYPSSRTTCDTWSEGRQSRDQASDYNSAIYTMYSNRTGHSRHKIYDPRPQTPSQLDASFIQPKTLPRYPFEQSFECSDYTTWPRAYYNK